MSKYDSMRDDALHFMCVGGWSNGEFGNVEAPTGFVWKISNDWEDVKPENGEFRSLMEDWFELQAEPDDINFRRSLVGDYLIREDSNGLVYVTIYTEKEPRDDEFHRLQDEFQKWDGQGDD